MLQETHSTQNDEKVWLTEWEAEAPSVMAVQIIGE